MDINKSDQDDTQLEETIEGGGRPSDRGSGSDSLDNSVGRGTSFSERWANVVNGYIRRPILDALHGVTQASARNPKICIASCIFLALAILVIGMATNFKVETDGDLLYTPKGSRPVAHSEWIDDESGFPTVPRNMLMIVHSESEEGDSQLLTAEGVSRVFDAVEAVEQTGGYDEICAKGGRYFDSVRNVTTCRVVSVTRFWNNSREDFDSFVAGGGDVRRAMSDDSFSDGTPVDHKNVIGTPVFDESGTLVSGRLFRIDIDLPDLDETEDFEGDALDNVEDLGDKWIDDPDVFLLEYFAERSFDDEFGRAIVADIPLVPAVFIVMSLFTCFIFAKWDRVRSMSLMGFGAVCSVLLALMAGYGLLFIIGTPLTSMTQILPFVIFGIGLDDAFIITGEYFRTDPSKDVHERIYDTVEAVGVSITLTTLTSTAAFWLGAISSVPVVYWLCYYAFPTIIFDYLFQLTFFIAVLVLDDRRVQQKRMDCCVCLPVKSSEDSSDSVDQGDGSDDSAVQPRLEVRIMTWYSDQLMKTWVKIMVIIIFIGGFGAMIYSTSLLTQEFEFTDVVPDDSYITRFWDAYNDKTDRGALSTYAYFRYVEQSDKDIQQQMKDYVDDLVNIKAIGEYPTFFWLVDFENYANNATNSVANLTFNEQLDAFLQVEGNSELYGDHIIRVDGELTASRVALYLTEMEPNSVSDQIGVLEDQREVSENQEINRGQSDWRFFTFEELYFIWEFYASVVGELIMTTIFGVVAVTTLALVFIPHWSASLFICPMIMMCYIDLLGALQAAGLHINVVTYIALVMSIGLLVDFLMHVLLRYYESTEKTREAKVRDTLLSMGSSVLIGATSTLLGVIPLAFSASTIFSSVFVSFIALVLVGASHGLIFLPVLLSIFGPAEDSVVEAEEIEKTP